MIKIESLSFQYPGSSQPVFTDLDLDIPSNSLTLVTGVSGSGKSTLLRCLNGLIPHFSGGIIGGQIKIFGLNPILDGTEKMASKVGFVFQEPEAQFVYDVVEDEIAFALENFGICYESMQEKVNDILEKLSIQEIRHKKINDISGGEKQLVAIASALVGGKKLLILDEPTSQLDPQTADVLLSIITRMKQEVALTIIIAEHRLERLLPYVDNLIHLQANAPPIVGAPRDVISQIEQVPPIIKIAKKLQIYPLPIRIEEFPDLQVESSDFRLNPPTLAAKQPQKSILTLTGVSASIDQQVILNSINLDVRKGEIHIILGSNGAGKTTLLRSILGLLPSKGDILLEGKNIRGLDFQKIVKHVAYLPQNPNDLLFADTVIEELRITLKNHDMKISHDELVSFLLQFKLNEKENVYPRDLSIGERQRVALAAIIIADPEIILLDEPTRGLDYSTKSALNSFLKALSARGTTIILVTHDIEFAAQLADRVSILERGEITFSGHPSIAFKKFLRYRTQTAQLFPDLNWITPRDVAI